jgi:NAD(P)-dependent dehydrogenase (short-subunit alcohol dehydrogenase family)
MTPRCVVFGGTGDIGGAIADQLTHTGCEVMTVSRRPPATAKSSTRHVLADVTEEDSVVGAVREILQGGSIDAVVYAAGFSPDVRTPLSGYATSNWRRTFAVYVDGLFYVYKAVFPFLISDGHFAVISSAITRLSPNALPPFHAGHYAAAKAAVDEFSKWARREAHAKGVLFSRLAPGSVRSAASAILGVPEAGSLPLDAVAQRVVTALINHEEIDEQMLVQAH